MSAPVDVLAKIRANMGSHSETLAAVAELIEADKEYDAANLSGNCIRIADVAVRRREAIARVGGAA